MRLNTSSKMYCSSCKQISSLPCTVLSTGHGTHESSEKVVSFCPCSEKELQLLGVHGMCAVILICLWLGGVIHKGLRCYYNIFPPLPNVGRDRACRQSSPLLLKLLANGFPLGYRDALLWEQAWTEGTALSFPCPFLTLKMWTAVSNYILKWAKQIKVFH